MQPTPPPQPNTSPEARPQPQAAAEKKPADQKPELNRAPAPATEAAAPSTSTPSAAAKSSLTSPLNSAKPAAPGQATGVSTSLPAEDVDVIEKEWVDRAENIIRTTANDPQREEVEEESLSKEYLKKRFNVDVDDA